MSKKQAKQRARFKKASKSCKGKSNYRGCMRKKLKGR
jgi:hypothetical protein